MRQATLQWRRCTLLTNRSIRESCKGTSRGPSAWPNSKYRSLHPAAMATASGTSMPVIVQPQWLQQRLDANDSSLCILDGTWYLPNSGKEDPLRQFATSRIPGSKFFELEAIADTGSGLPHMLPSEASFAAAADTLGISNDSNVVVYDRSGVFSAPRVWWTFKVFGHDNVAVLDGGLPAWEAAGLPVDRQPVSMDQIRAPGQAAQQQQGHATSAYQATLQRQQVRDWQQVLANVSSQQELVVDARGAGRFAGTAAEPRPGMRSGHIPGSKNVPFDRMLTDNRFKEPKQLLQVFQDAGVDISKPLVTSCGTGVTASVLALALQQLQSPHVAVYDGSWSEWGSRQDTPVAKSE